MTLPIFLGEILVNNLKDELFFSCILVILFLYVVDTFLVYWCYFSCILVLLFLYIGDTFLVYWCYFSCILVLRFWFMPFGRDKLFPHSGLDRVFKIECFWLCLVQMLFLL